ncbi:aspartate/glutamate racemase family protein [Pacificoceanicola onchidii]|uniref:aspartate/glutamate racemase family protein n=1 Tax=Pacificoceanicola onchidii TaxID=2562685 RepID=UPI0010A662E2|nr:aspartate/glutamate racemase family protein [Pacificoceanicola onchidii]
MTVIIINPNSTASMTQAMVQQAQRAVPGLAFEGWTSEEGPAAIQGPTDGDAASGPLLRLVEQASKAGAEGIIIGCFDDTALDEAARRAPCPVIGLGQATYHYAALRGWRFSVVTTLPVSVPILEANIARQGLTGFAARVRASDVPVLALEEDAAAAGAAVVAEALRAEQEDDISAVILGCAGMVQVLQQVDRALTLPVIDPVTCAARSMTWLL